MKTIFPGLFLLLFLLPAGAQTNAKKFNRPLYRQLHRMEKKDQAARNAYYKVIRKHAGDSARIRKVNAEISRIDSVNYIQVHRIFLRYGYPNYDLVRQMGEMYFWLIVQHMDDHPQFQDSVLTAMKVEVDSGKANRVFYAYLTDRVKTNNGQLQVYGTQMQLNADSTSYEPMPVIDPEHLDERRKSMGLPPIAVYIKQMNEGLPRKKED